MGREVLRAEGDRVHAGARAAAGLHRRAGGRRSRRDARRHRAARRRPEEGQPAAAGRARHRSLGAGRSLSRAQRRRPQRRARVRPQQGALHVPALGAGSVPELPRRAARHRHRAPGQPRVPRARGLQGAVRRRRARLPGHARRHRLAHDDGQRARRRRLGRRRHRGRGRDARPADLDADSGSRRLPPHRSAARGRDGDRSRAHDHGAAPQVRRRRQVRRVLRARAGVPDDRRSRDARQHVARIRGDDRDLPDRRHDARLSASDGARRKPRAAGRGLREGAGSVPPGRRAGSRLHGDARARICRPSSRAWRARSARRIASRCASRSRSSSRRSS